MTKVKGREYHFHFTGRLLGAIGITYPCSKTVTASTWEEAKLKLYDTHDHISVIVEILAPVEQKEA